MEDRRRLMEDRRQLIAQARQISNMDKKPRRMCSRAPILGQTRRMCMEVRQMANFGQPFHNHSIIN